MSLKSTFCPPDVVKDLVKAVIGGRFSALLKMTGSKTGTFKPLFDGFFEKRGKTGEISKSFQFHAVVLNRKL